MDGIYFKSTLLKYHDISTPYDKINKSSNFAYNMWAQTNIFLSGFPMAKDSRHSSKIIRAEEKKPQESSKWLFLGNLIPEIESKAPN